MSINKDGKTYYEETEISLLRREADKDLKETFQWITKDLQDNAKAFVAVKNNLDAAFKELEKNSETLFGNGKEGVVTTLAKMVDVVARIEKSLNDKDSGLNAIDDKVRGLSAKEKIWDDAAKDIAKLTIKITVISGVIGFIGAFFGPQISKIIDSVLILMKG